ncbi:MAG: cytidylyltransferase domain-containing protein [Phycisphaerae bacterium]
MKTLGIILARAGSRGLPDKHLLPLLGRPVIEYTFGAALAAERLDAVAVSSDCQRVLQMAEKRGIETIQRPAELATGEASVQETLLHALDAWCGRGKPRPEAIALLYGNVPLREDGLIDRAVHHLHETGCDSVRSFCPVGKWHPAWMSSLSGDAVQPMFAGSIDRRQDLTPLFLHDGGAVVVTTAALEASRDMPQDPHAFFGKDRRGIQTQRGEVVEVDELRDLLLAEAIFKERLQPRYKVAS